jgi:hypothetical protein
VIVDDLDVERIAVNEAKADSPAPIYRHRPLSCTVAGQPMQADTPQAAQISQPGCRIEHSQQLLRCRDIKATEP